MTINIYITQLEAAAVLRISARTLERHRLTGTGPKFMKAGRRVLYRPADIEAWMNSNTFSSTAEMKGAA